MTTYYTRDHEWLRVDGNEATVGITDFAQNAMGDVVFVDLPETGTTVDAGGEVAVIESVKAASEVYAPAAGTINAVNDVLNDTPETINQSPQDQGWVYRMTLTDADALGSLMDETAYQDYLKELG